MRSSALFCAAVVLLTAGCGGPVVQNVILSCGDPVVARPSAPLLVQHATPTGSGNAVHQALVLTIHCPASDSGGS